MKLIALFTLLNTFFIAALANTGVEHDIGVPSHLYSESDSNTVSNEDAAVQICIFVAQTLLIIFLK